MPDEAFRRAVQAAARALAQQSDLRLDLPRKVGQHPTEIAYVRGAADAAAVKRRYHDALAHARLRPNEEPAGSVFDAAETARVEALGARAHDGVRCNLDLGLAYRYSKLDTSTIEDRDDAPIDEVVRLVVREWLTDAPPPTPAIPMVELWRPWFDEHARNDLLEMARYAVDQEAFALRVLSLIGKLPAPKTPKAKPPETQDEESRNPTRRPAKSSSKDSTPRS